MRFRTLLLVAALAATALAAAPAAPVHEAGCDDLELIRDLDADPLPYGLRQACPGIRPGAEVTSDVGGCTFNFVFRGTSYDAEGNPVDEGLFIGTAGHCIIDGEEPAQTYADPKPVARDGAGKRVGVFEFAVDQGVNDFALIRIDDWREPEVNPAMCHFGGPTAMATVTPRGTVGHHFGFGLGYSEVVPGRSAVAWTETASQVSFLGTSIFGDSGSGVIDSEGRAVGVLVTLSTTAAPGGFDTSAIGPHIGMASQYLDIDFELVTAPLAD